MSNFYLEIIAKTENLIEISSKSKIELIKAAYHLGTRHVEVEIEEDILLTKSDYVIENMLLNFKVDIKNNLYKLMSLDKWTLSSKDSVEIREQQTQMAKSLFDLNTEFGFEYLYKKNKKNSWPLAWSWACYCFEISKLEMVENFFFSWSANQLSAALRLIPIGSTKAQLIQRDLLEIISKVSKEIMDKEIDDIYFGNVGLAMAQQNHNDLYTKLFRN